MKIFASKYLMLLFLKHLISCSSICFPMICLGVLSNFANISTFAILTTPRLFAVNVCVPDNGSSSLQLSVSSYVASISLYNLFPLSSVFTCHHQQPSLGQYTYFEIRIVILVF